MSMVNKFASQPISDALIDELADLLYEASISSCTPRKDIRRIVGDFKERQRLVQSFAGSRGAISE